MSSSDEQLAKNLAVSIQTIRLDRLSLNIPELRERTRQMAENAQVKLKAIDKKDIVGDLIDLELNHSGISMLKITPDMVLEKTGVAKVPVYAGATLVAKAEVIRRELNKYIIWVKIRNNNEEVFRAKFIIVPCPDERTTQAYENRA